MLLHLCGLELSECVSRCVHVGGSYSSISLSCTSACAWLAESQSSLFGGCFRSYVGGCECMCDLRFTTPNPELNHIRSNFKLGVFNYSLLTLLKQCQV